MRAIFCGTPEIAVPAFNALSEIATIVGVVCQPDRPSGRGMKLRAPAVKKRALELNLEVFQPEKVRDGTLATWMSEKNADVALVIAYGRILGPDVLAAPRLGCVNLHASLLPLYRGAAPIQRAIMNGEDETGVCLMKMDEGMDTGAILSSQRLAIEPNETSGTLALKLGELAAQVTRESLPPYVAGSLQETPQDHSQATHAPPIEKSDCGLDFTQSAQLLAQQVRALAPRPGASAQLNRKELRRKEKPSCRFKLLEVSPADSALDRNVTLKPGVLLVEDGRILVGTGKLPLTLRIGQLEGKRAQSASELINGRTLSSGDYLS